MLEVGTTDKRAGYVTILKFIVGKSTYDLERLIGYSVGSLAAGYTLGLLTDRVGPNDFRFAGYTHFEDGKPTGRDEAVHDSLRASHAGHPQDRAQWQAMLKKGAERLNRDGIDRVCKVFPNRPVAAYEVGEGIAQFQLVVPKTFEIVLATRPGQKIFRNHDGTLKVL